MGKSQAIRGRDVRALLRLAGELGELSRHDVRDRQRHVLRGMREILGTRAGLFVHLAGPPGKWFDRMDPPLYHEFTPDEQEHVDRFFAKQLPFDAALPKFLSLPGVVAIDPAELLGRPEWLRQPYHAEVLRAVGVGEILYSKLPSRGGGGVLGMALHRGPRDRPFDRRACTLVELFHAEVGRLYIDVVPRIAGSDGGAAAEIAALPPRVRRVLDRLLLGDSEKQAAAALGITRGTAHDYVKDLYRRLNVHSRAELMVKCLKPGS
jgi:DNA-binding CsgD family transcriptional regulator